MPAYEDDQQYFVPSSLPGAESPEAATSKMEFYLMLVAAMIFFFVCAGAIEKYKPRCGHQTSYTIILGVIFSLILYACLKDARADDYQFKQELFFDFLLPPIILNSGFNMRRKKFFQNIGNIAIFGLGVTFVCFTLYSVASWVALNYGDLQMQNYHLQSTTDGAKG